MRGKRRFLPLLFWDVFVRPKLVGEIRDFRGGSFAVEVSVLGSVCWGQIKC